MRSPTWLWGERALWGVGTGVVGTTLGKAAEGHVPGDVGHAPRLTVALGLIKGGAAAVDPPANAEGLRRPLLGQRRTWFVELPQITCRCPLLSERQGGAAERRTPTSSILSSTGTICPSISSFSKAMLLATSTASRLARCCSRSHRWFGPNPPLPCCPSRERLRLRLARSRGKAAPPIRACRTCSWPSRTSASR